MRKVSVVVIGIALAAMTVSSAFAGKIQSGLSVGDMTPPFHPQHVAGPDRGTQNCPVCTYGNRPAVQVYVNTDSAANVTAIAEALGKAMKSHADKQLKAFIVFINAKPADVHKIAARAKVGNVDMAVLSGPNDPALREYKINTDKSVKNTVLVYHNRKVAATFVNLNEAKDGKKLDAAIAAICK